MIAREKNLNEISDALSFLKTRVELRNSLSLFDPNIHAEYFYANLLNLVYGLNLKNINAETKNAGYIDLIDRNAKHAIQVTSQNDKAKIEKTIKGFYANHENAEYKLQLLLIAKEAKGYRTDFSVGGKNEFNHKKDVIDVQRLLGDISKLGDEKLAEIAEFLNNAIRENTKSQGSRDNRAIINGNTNFLFQGVRDTTIRIGGPADESEPFQRPPHLRSDDGRNRPLGNESNTLMGILAVVALVVVLGVVAIVVFALGINNGQPPNANTASSANVQPSPMASTNVHIQNTENTIQNKENTIQPNSNKGAQNTRENNRKPGNSPSKTPGSPSPTRVKPSPTGTVYLP